MNPGQIANLDNQFPQAAFPNKVKIAPGTQAIRTSTGLEIDVILPIVQAPFRVYYAYNPTIVREYLQPPIVVDRSTFPNAATFTNAIAIVRNALPLFEKRGTFSGLPSAGLFEDRPRRPDLASRRFTNIKVCSEGV